MNTNTIDVIKCINKTMEAWANYLQAGGVDYSNGGNMNLLMETITQLYQEQPNSNPGYKDAIIEKMTKPCPNCGHSHDTQYDKTPKR